VWVSTGGLALKEAKRMACTVFSLGDERIISLVVENDRPVYDRVLETLGLYRKTDHADGKFYSALIRFR